MIPFSTLNDLYYSYCTLFNEDKIILISNEKDNATLKNAYISLQKLLQTYINQPTNPYHEIDFISTISTFKSNSTELINKSLLIRQISNYKTVFFNEINTLYFKLSQNNEEYCEFVTISNKIIDSWNKLITRFILNCRKGISSDKSVELEEIIKLEVIYREKIINELKLLIDIKHLYLGPNIALNSIFKIDDPSQLIFIKSNEINFLFKEKDIYNTWIEDKCPKILINKCHFSALQNQNFLKMNNGQLLFSLKVSVIDSSSVQFMAGIILKLNNNTTYIFGLEQDNRLNIEKTGSISSLFSTYEDTKDIKLYVCINNTQTHFYYSKNLSTKIKLGELPIKLKEIDYIGLCCKKWSQGNLTITFKDINIPDVP